MQFALLPLKARLISEREPVWGWGWGLSRGEVPQWCGATSGSKFDHLKVVIGAKADRRDRCDGLVGLHGAKGIRLRLVESRGGEDARADQNQIGNFEKLVKSGVGSGEKMCHENLLAFSAVGQSGCAFLFTIYTSFVKR